MRISEAKIPEVLILEPDLGTDRPIERPLLLPKDAAFSRLKDISKDSLPPYEDK